MTEYRQLSFAGGEVAPGLYARVDFFKYATGLRNCRNFYVMKQGGVANRPGTKFITEIKDSTRTLRLMPFVFNDDQTYVLEFGHQYIRFIRNDAYVTVSGVTAWSGATGYGIGDLVSRLGINYYCILAHTNQQPPNATYWYPLTSDIYEIPTDYQEEDLSTIEFVQSADIITIVHPDYPPAELQRFDHTEWILSDVVFGPSIAAPDLSSSPSVKVGNLTSHIVTAVSISGEESLGSNDQIGGDGATDTLSWPAVTGAVSYRVYKLLSTSGLGTYGFLVEVTDTTFEDDNSGNDDIDYSRAVPGQTARNPFSSSGNYPSAVMYAQQRLFYGGTNNDPETIWASRVGSFRNFEIHVPLQDDDSLQFTLAGKYVNRIRHLLEMNRMFPFTSGAEWVVQGNDAGIILPTAINARQQTLNGSGDLPPILVNGSILYAQARGSIVRDFLFDFELDTYRGNDLTIFSSHLFNRKTLLDWTFQDNPSSIIWVARDDGTLLGLTYVREQQMLAWHRHDFENGAVENVVCIPDGTEDSLYLLVRRVIDGSTVRYIEKMTSHNWPDEENTVNSNIVDAIFLDSALTYDGRNIKVTHTLTLTGGTDWDHEETLALTSSESFFVPGDVGNEIQLLTDGFDDVIRLEIVGYTDHVNATVRPNKTVPSALRNVARVQWARAIDEITGLDHLEGEEVSVFADGFVVGSPNNANYDTFTVSGGSITLPRPYAVVHVGLPITSDIETLDIDTVNAKPLANKKKLITEITMFVENSRGIFAGPKPPTDDDDDPLEGLEEFQVDEDEDTDDPVPLQTNNIDIQLKSEWNSNGRVFIRQVDPLPLKILSIIPTGYIPYER